MITALVTASGPLGLSAFFPAKEVRCTNAPPFGAYPKYLPPPHLPLTATWHETDFSLQSVLSTTAYPNERVNLREYTMKLLSRYQYLSGESNPFLLITKLTCSKKRTPLPHAQKPGSNCRCLQSHQQQSTHFNSRTKR